MKNLDHIPSKSTNAHSEDHIFKNQRSRYNINEVFTIIKQTRTTKLIISNFGRAAQRAYSNLTVFHKLKINEDNLHLFYKYKGSTIDTTALSNFYYDIVYTFNEYDIVKDTISLFNSTTIPITGLRLFYHHNKSYLFTNCWKNIRNEVIKKARYICEMCNKKTNGICHHNSYKYFGTGSEAELNSCGYLCHECHSKLHYHYYYDFDLDLFIKWS